MSIQSDSLQRKRANSERLLQNNYTLAYSQPVMLSNMYMNQCYTHIATQIRVRKSFSSLNLNYDLPLSLFASLKILMGLGGLLKWPHAIHSGCCLPRLYQICHTLEPLAIWGSNHNTVPTIAASCVSELID